MILTAACYVSGLTTSPLSCCSPSTLAVLNLIILRQAHSEEITRERTERQRLERDLEEASRRLAMAHQDIRRLNSELDAAKNNNQDPCGMSKTHSLSNHKCIFSFQNYYHTEPEAVQLCASHLLRCMHLCVFFFNLNLYFLYIFLAACNNNIGKTFLVSF